MTYMLDIDAVRKSAHHALERILQEVAEGAASGRVVELDATVRAGLGAVGEALVSSVYQQVADQTRTAQRRCAVLPDCPNCVGPTRFKQSRPLMVRTVLTGRGVEVLSPYSVCDRCHVGVHALRRELQLDTDGTTPALRSLAVAAGTIEPFESASADLLQRFAGVSLSGSKVHSLCQTAGERLAMRMDEEALGEVTPLQPGERLYVQIDGGMLHIGGEWREAKLAVIFPGSAIADVSKERRALTQRHVVHSLSGREELGRRILNVVERYVPKDADGRPLLHGRVHVLGDGAEWISNLAREDLPGATYLLDWFHAADHIAAASRVLYTNELGRQRWYAKQLKMLRDGRVPGMLTGLVAQRAKHAPGSPAHEALADLYRYLNRRADQLWYALARRQGLHIGSGVVESANNYVLQQRMKRAGMRWEARGADAMAALRSAYRTGGTTLLAQVA